MGQDNLADLTIEKMAEYVARGHAYNKHVEGAPHLEKTPDMKAINAFNATEDLSKQPLGPDLKIRTPDDLHHYIVKTIDDPATKGFMNPITGDVTICNTRDNVAIHFTPNNGQQDFGTIYRYSTTTNDFQNYQTYASSKQGFRPYQAFDNSQNPGSARVGIDGMISDLKANPHLYKGKAATVADAKFSQALNNPDRPGRGPSDGITATPSNNMVGHSDDYAKLNNLEPAAAKLAGTIDNVAAAVDPAAIKAAAKTADVADAAADGAKLLKPLTTLGKETIVLTVVATGLSVLLTERALAANVDAADSFHASGELTTEQHAAYARLMDDLGPKMLAQSADPTPLALPGGVAIEAYAFNKFSDVANQYDFPANVMDALNPSIIPASALRAEVSESLYKALGTDPAQAPEVLKTLATAKAEAELAHREFASAWRENLVIVPMPMGAGVTDLSYEATMAQPAVQAAQAKVDAAMDRFDKAFNTTLKTHDGASAIAGLLPQETLLEVIEDTAQYKTGAQDALVQNFVQKQDNFERARNPLNTDHVESAWTYIFDKPYQAGRSWAMRDNARAELLANPGVMRDYFISNFAGPSPSSPQAQMKMERNPSYIGVAIPMERIKAGETPEPVELREMNAILNKPNQNGAILEFLNTRYGAQIEPFMPKPPEPLFTPVPVLLSTGQPQNGNTVQNQPSVAQPAMR